MLDVSAFIVLLVILFMPPPSIEAIGAYDHRAKGDKARDVERELAVASDLQARLLADPSNGRIAEQFAAQMRDLGRFDMAFRIGGSSAAPQEPKSMACLGSGERCLCREPRHLPVFRLGRQSTRGLSWRWRW